MPQAATNCDCLSYYNHSAAQVFGTQQNAYYNQLGRLLDLALGLRTELLVLSYFNHIENMRLEIIDLQSLNFKTHKLSVEQRLVNWHTSATNVKAQHEGRMRVKVDAQTHREAHLQCSDSADC